MSTKRNNPETIAIHGGDYRSDPATNAVAVPIYRTTSYEFNSTEHAANLFSLKEFGNIYTRIMNPTNDVLEKRIAALEGGLSCVTVSSGQTASTFAVLNVAQAGDNIISSTDLYGGTVSLFTHTLSKLGIDFLSNGERINNPTPKDFPLINSVSTKEFDPDINLKVLAESVHVKFVATYSPLSQPYCALSSTPSMVLSSELIQVSTPSLNMRPLNVPLR